MKSSRSRIALLALLCGTSALQADILILKNGTKVEGNILSESPAVIRMKYRLTPKIWDEKDFQVSEIQQVIKQSPQEVELIELKKILPTPDLLTADKYEQIIQDRVRPFINKYAGTPEAKEAQTLETTLQEEKKRVSNGESKLEGRWLTAAETKGEAYNVQAYRVLNDMRSDLAKTEWLEALRKFDTFYRNRPPLVASTYYPAAIKEALAAMSKLDAQLSRMAQEQPALQKRRDDELKKLPDAERARTKAAIDEERNKWRAQSDAERRGNIRWIEPYKYDLPSILAAQKVLVGEKTRLDAINLEDLKTRNDAFTAVYRKIGEGDYAGGASAFERVQSFSNVPEYRDVVADQKSQLMALYNQIVAKSRAGQTAVSGSSAISGSTSTTVDDRVARILAEANGGTAPAAAAGTPAATAPRATAPAAATPGATAAAPVAAAPAAGYPAQAQAPRPAQPAVPAAAPQAQAPVVIPQEESNVQTYIIVGLVALLAVFGFVAFKKKKD